MLKQISEFDTLVVMLTHRGEDIVLDQIDAIFWSCKSKIKMIVVDDSKKIKKLNIQNVEIVHTKAILKKENRNISQKVNDGITYALNKKYNFKMVMVIDDDALPINGKGLDVWALNIFTHNKNIGCIGSKDDAIYSKDWMIEKIKNHFNPYFPNINDFVFPERQIFYAVNFQSRSFIDKAFKNGLLDTKHENYPFPSESFLTNCVKLMGFENFYWGEYPDNLVPPLYSSHHGRKKPIDPRLIDEKFLIHHSIKNVPYVSENEIREHYYNERKKS